MGQGEILNYLEKNKGRMDITIVELSKELGTGQSTLSHQVKQLIKGDFIIVQCDGRKQMIGYNDIRPKLEGICMRLTSIRKEIEDVDSLKPEYILRNEIIALQAMVERLQELLVRI